MDEEQPRPAVLAFVLALMEASSGLGLEDREMPRPSSVTESPHIDGESL